MLRSPLSTEIELLPDVNEPLGNLDNLYWRLARVSPGDKVVFDLKKLSFIRPIGIMTIFLAAKDAYESTGEKIRLKNLANDVLLYLDRVNFFQYGFVFTEESIPFFSRLARSQRSLSIVEIERLDDPRHVINLRDKIARILEAWFPSAQRYTDSALKIVVELCNNGIEHSRLDEDYGECYCLLQKYTHGSAPEVVIAIGDLGVGIRTHLKSKFGWNHSDGFFIQKALEGVSGRKTGSGGLGLRRTQSIVQQYGGRLVMRSGKGVVLMEQTTRVRDLNHALKGTQCTIHLRAGGQS